jgi:CRP-like cAMP-binding protein
MSPTVATAPGSIARPATAFAVLGGLRQADMNHIRSFWRNVVRYTAGAIVYAGRGSAGRRIIIISGWACETRILADGRRQIFSFLLPGDAIDLAQMSGVGSRAVMALTRLEVIDAEIVAASQAHADQDVAAAVAQALRQREDRMFDHMVRIGRLTAKERVLNLLLEFYDRLDAVGLTKGDTFRIPLTQEVFADTLGLSNVHINRTLQQLRRDGLIVLKAGSVTLPDRERLAHLACYEQDIDEQEARLDSLRPQ